MERGECKVVGSCTSQWREMLGDGGENERLRTVECLRGRLLAEREASKAAKDEADLMMKRLMELERLLAEEMKHRDKAEKRLRFALKKLKSLKLIDASGTSTSSEGILNSTLRSSTSASSDGKRSDQNSEDSLKQWDNEKGRFKGSNSVNSSVDPLNNAVSEEGSWSSVGSAPSVNMVNKDCPEECNELMNDSNIGEFTDNKRNVSTCSQDSNDNRHQVDLDHTCSDPCASLQEGTKSDTENKTPNINQQI